MATLFNFDFNFAPSLSKSSIPTSNFTVPPSNMRTPFHSLPPKSSPATITARYSDQRSSFTSSVGVNGYAAVKVDERIEAEVAEGLTVTELCDKVVDLFLNEKPKTKDWKKYLIFRDEWSKYRERFYTHCREKAEKETDVNTRHKLISLGRKVKKIDDEMDRHAELLKEIQDSPMDINAIVTKRRADFTEEFFRHLTLLSDTLDSLEDRDGGTIMQVQEIKILERNQPMEKSEDEQKHFVLIHGTCHGKWCWYKVKTKLELAGHKVTALDMAASGMDTRSIQGVQTVAEYTAPLLEFMDELPPNKKVVLVGHSFGGINISLAMEKFPEKISVAVFLTAFMPDIVNPPSYVVEQLFARVSPANWLDTIHTTQGSPSESPAIFFFGPEFMKQKLYQNSPIEDLEAALTLTRPGSLYISNLSREEKFTAEGYGSVKRVYVVCGEDLAIPKEVQHWMITNYGTTIDTAVIPNADHMAMFSKPDEVVKCLLDAAVKYS